MVLGQPVMAAHDDFTGRQGQRCVVHLMAAHEAGLHPCPVVIDAQVGKAVFAGAPHAKITASSCKEAPTAPMRSSQ
jgi:hypothetical protein